MQVASRRLLDAIPTMLLLSMVVFVVLRALPADPLALLLPPNATRADAEAMKAAMGLDRSLPVQYMYWLRDALSGNLGRSISFGQQVTLLIGNALPATLELSMTGLALALLVSIPGGILFFAVRGQKKEVAFDALIVSMLSLPTFLWGLLLMLVFGVLLGVMPVAGRIDPGAVLPAGTGFLLFDYLVRLDWSGFVNAASHLALPAIALCLGFSPMVMRVLRSSLLEASADQYVQTARLRGLSETRILVFHMLRNAALPTITLIGAQLGFLFGGTLLIESIFSFPGLGNLMVQAVRNHDLPLIQGIALVFCATTLVINTIVDVLYVVLNPKLRIKR